MKIIERPEFSKNADIQALFNKVYVDEEQIENDVMKMLRDIKQNGDQAVLGYIKKFDGADLKSTELRVSTNEIEKAYEAVDEKFLDALKIAIKNITSYHQKQLQNSWIAPEDDGVILGQMVRPIERAGLYVPGGTAAYPSSVLMNAIPAKVAGVKEIVMVSPTDQNGNINPFTLVTANEVGVTEIYKVGGVQSVGALAYGTETIPKVNLITGPGNIYVTKAKKLVYGDVDIDMLAGPSEILIIADETANPSYIAADLLSQAEHDTLASSVLVTTSIDLAQAVEKELSIQLEKLPRKEFAQQSLMNYGAIVIVDDLYAAAEFSNQFAPEHLEVVVQNPFEWLPYLKNAGAIFLGENTPEPVGDYMAGPNHVLPTGGTAKFYSALNVDTFMKKTSIISYSRKRLEKEKDAIIHFAEMEGLEAHARSIKVRVGVDF